MGNKDIPEAAILSVDDEGLFQKLRSEDINVAAIIKGSEAINDAEETKSDLLLTNLMMSRALQRMHVQNQQLAEEITHRRLIEAQLRKSENRFRLALDAASSGIWDRELLPGEIGDRTDWQRNPGCEGRKKIDEQSFENLLHPDDRQKVLIEREAYVQGKSSRYEVEYRMRSESGGWRWMLSRGKVVERDGQGRAKRLIGTITDITRLKAVESELEQRVEKMNAELSELQVALTVLLKKRQEDRAILAEQVLSNTTKLVEPFLDRLNESRLSEQQQELIDIIRSTIHDLTSPFSRNLSSKLIRLTPAEIQVANLVKLGKRSKEIAEILNLSPGTVNIHRKNIRKKLEIANQKSNLQTVLSIIDS